MLQGTRRARDGYCVNAGWRAASPASRVAASAASSLENEPDNQQSAKQEGQQLRILVEP